VLGSQSCYERAIEATKNRFGRPSRVGSSHEDLRVFSMENVKTQDSAADYRALGIVRSTAQTQTNGEDLFPSSLQQLKDANVLVLCDGLAFVHPSAAKRIVQVVPQPSDDQIEGDAILSSLGNDEISPPF